MKLDIPKSIISLIISGLIAYGCYSICPFEELCCLLTGTTFGYLAITGLMTFGITINTLRNATVIKVFSGCMFFTGIVLNITFFFFKFNIPLYIISNGIILFMYLLICVSIWRSRQ